MPKRRSMKNRKYTISEDTKRISCNGGSGRTSIEPAGSGIKSSRADQDAIDAGTNI